MSISRYLLIYFIICAMTAMISYGIYVGGRSITNHRAIENALSYAVSHNQPTMFDEHYVDFWKNPIHVERDNKKDFDILIYIARSAGSDGQYFTNDDVIKTYTDINWSKKIGEAAGKAGKQAAKGFIEGITAPNNHDKE